MEIELEKLQRFVLEKVERDEELKDRIKNELYSYSYSLTEIQKHFQINSIYDAYRLFSQLLTVQYEKESRSKKLISYTLVTEQKVVPSMNKLVITFNKRVVEDLFFESLQIPESTTFLFSQGNSNLDVGYKTKDIQEKKEYDIKWLDVGTNTVDIMQEDGKLKISYPDGEIVELPLNADFPHFSSEFYEGLTLLKGLKNPLARYLVMNFYSMQKNEVRELPIDELKEKLGLTGKYEQYGHLKNKVINPALAELADNTPVCLEIEEVKTANRKVDSLLIKKMN